MEKEEAKPFELLDALPYFDTEWDSDKKLKTKVNEYIEEEMLLMQHTNPSFSAQQYLSHLPKIPTNEELFANDPVLKQILQEILERNKQPNLQFEQKYQSMIQSETESDCKIVYEYEQIKNVNLQLMERYNATKWKMTNEKLDHEKEFLKRKLSKIKDETNELNAKRKRDQLEAGRQIQILQQRYNDTIQRQFAIRKEIQNEQSKRIKLS